MLNNKKIESVIEISKIAGNEIMNIYKSDFKYEMKNDRSPLTKADKRSNDIICKSLQSLTPKIPVLSEESSDFSLKERSSWKKYWLVDPLDGTKEFIKRNGEFTVNIALMVDSKPVFGVIYLPNINHVYWGSELFGSYMINDNNSQKTLKVSENKKSDIKLVTSRSHPSPELSELILKMDDPKTISVGSSIKFCMVAEGKAECYPRLGPTSEWDIAAGSAILKFAGGIILDANGHEISYNSKNNFLIPNFIASNNREVAEQIIRYI